MSSYIFRTKIPSYNAKEVIYMKRDHRSYNNEYTYMIGDENGLIKLWKVPVGTKTKILIAARRNGIVMTTSSYNEKDDLEALNDFYDVEETE